MKYLLYFLSFHLLTDWSSTCPISHNLQHYFPKAKLQSSKKYFFYISSSLMVDLAISTGFKNYVRMMQEFWLLTSVEEMSSWNFSVDKNKGQSIFLKLLFAVLLIRSSVPVLNRKKMCRWPHFKNTRAKSAGLLNILNQKKVIYFWWSEAILLGSFFYDRHTLYWMGPTNMR